MSNTHNIEKIELAPKSTTDVGPQPTAVDMKSTPTPIVNDSLGNVNTNQPLKDLGKDNSPVTEYGFEVEGDTLGIVDPNFKTVTDAIENAGGKFRKFYTGAPEPSIRKVRLTDWRKRVGTGRLPILYRRQGHLAVQRNISSRKSL